MGKDVKAAGKAVHCRRRYKQINFRVRRESELLARLEEHCETGNTSVNFLITSALCEYLNCPIPHREYSTYERRRLI